MSLNRSEQMLFDYIRARPEEQGYWRAKVERATVDGVGEATPVRLEADLWRYFEERSRVASPFREAAAREGIARTSMRNLAEHLLRIWSPPRQPNPPR